MNFGGNDKIAGAMKIPPKEKTKKFKPLNRGFFYFRFT
jgi:hypothetical protein